MVVLVFLIASISLAIYAISIKEVGLTKRIIGAILAILLLLYLIYTIRKYLAISKKITDLKFDKKSKGSVIFRIYAKLRYIFY